MKARAAALGLAVALVAGAARADRDKAAAAYKQATEDFAKGAFAEAAASFDTAFAEDPRGASAYNAALSWQSAKDEPRAADDFARAVAAGDLDEKLLENAKQQLAKLEATLGRVAITGPNGARFALAHASGAAPALVHVAPGRYFVRATFVGGGSRDVPVDVRAGALAPVALAPPAVASPPPPPDVVVRRGIFGRATLPVALSLLGAGVVSGGFAIGLGFATVDAVHSYEATGYTSQSAHDDAIALRTWTNVTFVTALVLGAVGVAAVVTIHRVKVHATVGLGSIALAGTFE